MRHAHTCNRVDRWTEISLEATPDNSIELLHRHDVYRDYRRRFRHLRPCLNNNYFFGNPAAVYGLYFRKTHSSHLTSRVMFKSIKYNLINVERIKIHFYRDIHWIFIVLRFFSSGRCRICPHQNQFLEQFFCNQSAIYIWVLLIVVELFFYSFQFIFGYHHHHYSPRNTQQSKEQKFGA